MQKKLTITIDEEIYERLRTVVGPRYISRFIQELIRPHVLDKNLEDGYRQMAQDEEREQGALESAEATLLEISDEPR